MYIYNEWYFSRCNRQHYEENTRSFLLKRRLDYSTRISQQTQFIEDGKFQLYLCKQNKAQLHLEQFLLILFKRAKSI